MHISMGECKKDITPVLTSFLHWAIDAVSDHRIMTITFASFFHRLFGRLNKLSKVSMFIHYFTKRQMGSQKLSWHFNSLAPEICSCNLKSPILKLILKINILSISSEFALKWMPEGYTNEVKIGACSGELPANQATTHHYLNQCWPKFVSPYSVTGPQWVKGHIC